MKIPHKLGCIKHGNDGFYIYRHFKGLFLFIMESDAEATNQSKGVAVFKDCWEGIIGILYGPIMLSNSMDVETEAVKMASTEPYSERIDAGQPHRTLLLQYFKIETSETRLRERSGDVSDIKLTETDTTLDLSQKVEKRIKKCLDLYFIMNLRLTLCLCSRYGTWTVEDCFLLVSSKAWNGYKVLSHFTLFFEILNLFIQIEQRIILRFRTNYFYLKSIGAAQTQAPTATNYDVGSPSWGDLKAAPLPSEMQVTALGHESS
ncbi:hypothetical protein CXB51_026673 [Gossypium anomalum]|uniref:Uncharacterized protein n=1 Tax=Gossypium anomalum TaxID=47600 RepID=A0A8J5YET1_9ROSI|nr:hypothetical protein CXB51_026673 [Gossypium anomalum]